MSIPRDTITKAVAAGLHLQSRSEELHEEWRSARNQALLAYRVWSQAASLEKRDAYVAYVAAADREAAAADHMRLTATECASCPASAQAWRTR